MTCEEARALFSVHVDGAMDPAAAARLTNHLSACPGCQHELARFQEIVGALRSLPEVRAPAGFLPRVMRQLPPDPWLWRVLRSVFLPLSVKLPLEAAAMVLIGILTVVLYRGSPAWQSTFTPPAPNGLGVRSDRPAPDTSAPVDAKRQPTKLPAPTPDRPDTDARGARGEAIPKRSETPPAVPPAIELEQRIPARESAKRSDSAQEASPADKADAAHDRISRDDKGAAPAPKSLGAPPPEARTEAGGTPGSAESPSASERPSAVRSTRLAPVDGVLRVVDRAAFDRALPPVLARAGATLTSNSDYSTLTISVPRASFARLASDLQELGVLTLGTLPDPLPDLVNVSLRIVT